MSLTSGIGVIKGCVIMGRVTKGACVSVQVHLVAQLESCLSHGPLHLVMGDEPVSLGGLAWTPPARNLEGGEETIHVPRVILDQLHGVVKLCAVVNPHAAIEVSGDDVVVSVTLHPCTWKRGTDKP